MSLWAFRFLLFYIVILCVQPQNRFTFLHPLQIADLSIIAALGFHAAACSQEGVRFIRMGPATVTALILIVASIISLFTGPWQTSSAWNANNEVILKNGFVLIMVEAMAFTVQRVWAVQATLLLSTLWWVKGGLRLAASGATYQGDRLMGPAVSMIENPNGFAFLMTVMIPLYLYFYQKTPHKYLRIGYLILALFSTYIVLETGSRTGLIALIAVAVFLLPKYGAQHKVALGTIGIVVFLLGGIISSGNIERFKSIPASARSFLSGVDESANVSKMTIDEQSAWERKMKNKHTWDLIMEYPLFGVGVNGDDAANLNWEKHPYAYGQVHNDILFVGKQMGMIGMGLYFSLMVTLIVSGMNIQKAAADWWPALGDLGWTFKMQALVFIVGGFFSPLPWSPLFMIIVGSASALWYNVQNQSLDATTAKM